MVLKSEKILIILGPTATGKSDFAVHLAKMLNGEIISADSRQVYKGLDIGAGKITKKEMSGIPHHLLDIADPNDIERYTAKKWVDDAEKAIADIQSRCKLPIICGGTGFYISALLGEVNISDVEPDEDLREDLNTKNLEELNDFFAKLPEKNGVNKSKIDTKNKVKLMRAIEILLSDRVPAETDKIKDKLKYEYVKIGLTLPDDVLKEKIKDRLLKRLDPNQNNGESMMSEAQKLMSEGVSKERMYELGLEYRYLSMCISGEITVEKMIETLNTKIWQYARRQKTWFKRFTDIKWIDPRGTTPQMVANFNEVKNLLS